MSRDKLDNSLHPEKREHWLSIEHARVMQAIISAKAVIENALDTYSQRKKQETHTSSDLLWITYPALTAAKKILEEVSDGN